MEDSTYWNPSWTLARGAIETTNITDMTTTADAIGSGVLLSKTSHDLQISPGLRGRTTAVQGCPTCMEQSLGYTYGMGVVLSNEEAFNDKGEVPNRAQEIFRLIGAAAAPEDAPPTRRS